MVPAESLAGQTLYRIGDCSDPAKACLSLLQVHHENQTVRGSSYSRHMDTARESHPTEVETITELRGLLTDLAHVDLPALLETATDSDSGTGTAIDRPELKALAAQLTRVSHVLDAMNLDVANSYRDLTRQELAVPDPEGRKVPLTGQRLVQESRRVAAQELSPEWRISPAQSRTRVGLARAAVDTLPRTMSAFRAGGATEAQVQNLLKTTVVLGAGDQARVDAEAAPILEQMTDHQARAWVQSRACELDAASMVERAKRAEKDAHVSVRPAPDCMTRLSALLPLRDGVAIDVALTRHAQRLRAQGDPRSLGQLKAALLTAWVRDGARRMDAGSTTWDTDTGEISDSTTAPGPGAVSGPSTAPGTSPKVEVQVVITDLALLGLTETPAWVTGHGPVPAGIAQEMISRAQEEGQACLRRLWAEPATGTLTTMESRSRIFPPGLAHFIRIRDQQCRTPFCSAPIRQIDHIRAHADGGATTAGNGQGLCTACNQVKEHLTIAPERAAPNGSPVPHESVARLARAGLTRARRRPPDVAPSPCGRILSWSGPDRAAFRAESLLRRLSG